MDRLYAEKKCSPSRASLLIGRFGIHVNAQVDFFYEFSYHLDDPIGGYVGIPLNMTTMAKEMKDAGQGTRQAWSVNGMHDLQHKNTLLLTWV